MGCVRLGCLSRRVEPSAKSVGAVDARLAQYVSDCDCPLLWLITSVVTCSSLSSLPVPHQEHVLHSSGPFYKVISSAELVSFPLQAHSHFFQEAFLGFSTSSAHQSLSHPH